ncbi:MAG TPA: FecR family protein [Candidatus Acidoferrum sp.]|nr:FecR family protein [Candidatus Acidoferrum sp.]
MTLRTFFRVAATSIVAVFFVALHPVYTAASHARIIRLSLVQGDVRILHDSKGDPLANDKAPWERAELNLPIRQHDVLATDNGRAQVEFENGAMAFLNENSVLEFFDLSLDDGSLTTRLILRQGTGSFYVNPAHDDYFSVTGGDFTAEAAGRTNFRMDNFDDGSTVAVSKGEVSVVHNKDTQLLVKGQFFTMSANGESSISRAPQGDDFDHWVSGREDSVVTATNAAAQYSNSSTYVSGFGDLYTYGGFYPVAGLGYGWQPYGVGLGWSPFDYGYGNWFYGSQFGWSFIGSQPWGWLPYHYGGWFFQPGIGWLWVPNGFRGGNVPVKYHPVTATFVRSGSTVAMVPTHPLDSGSKKPLNLTHVMPLNPASGAQAASAGSDGKWKVVKEVPAQSLVSHATPATVPTRSTRTLGSSTTSGQPNRSTIAFDAKEHRFVNSNVNASTARMSSSAATSASSTSAPTAAKGSTTTAAAARTATIERQVRTMPSASARVGAPPPASRSYGSARGGFFGGGGSGARGATSAVSTSHATMSGGSHVGGGGRH